MSISIQWYSNDKCLADAASELPFIPESNYYRAVVQCIDFAGNEPSFMRSSIAIIPVDETRRLVVMS